MYLLLLHVFALLVEVEGFLCKSFQRPATRSLRAPTKAEVLLGDEEHILEKTQRILQKAARFNEQVDSQIRSIFPESITTSDLQYRVVATLAERGFTAANTLLATSLCSDELAKCLADDFVNIYGSNFNIGGLAGFPFAGNIGFQTMSGHIPDSGFCLFVFGPHVGVTSDGVIGCVEREGVSLNDMCCRSAIEASKFSMGTSSGVAQNDFTDFQQGAIQNLMAPLSTRLQASQCPMLELPYAIYDVQNELMEGIVSENIGGVKEGIALLGGVQINTGPHTLDYFHPLRFDLINSQGEWAENMIDQLK